MSEPWADAPSKTDWIIRLFSFLIRIPEADFSPPGRTGKWLKELPAERAHLAFCPQTEFFTASRPEREFSPLRCLL
jgi:hypothetical protein